MLYFPTAAEMAEIDRITIEEVGIPQMVLMEKAALCVASEIMNRIDLDKKILCVVESGNNGGDGVALARILVEKGYDAELLFVAGLSKQTDAFMAQYSIASNCDVKIHNTGLLQRKDELESFDVIVDAIFGVGLTREVAGIQKNVIDKLNELNALKVAVDIPSGISADNGFILGTAFKADLTVTFGFTKLGMLLNDGRDYSGHIIVKEIGFARKAVEKVDPKCFTYSRNYANNLVPKRGTNANKGNFGKVLVVAGSKNMCGACIFAAESALRTGAGLVRIFTSEANREIIQTRLPEAMLTTYDEDNFTDNDILKLMGAMDWATVTVCGPGLGTADFSKKITDTVLSHSDKPLVLDADGINNADKELLKARKNVIMTPHLLEMARLVKEEGQSEKDIIADIKADRISLAKKYAEEYNICLVLKDARTVVTKTGRKTYINTTGNNGMSKGGSGDALTGIIAGLIAMGMTYFEAAALGTYIHGRAGDIARERKCEYSMTASDLTGCIADAMRNDVLNRQIIRIDKEVE